MLELVREHFLLAFVLVFLTLMIIGDIAEAFIKRHTPVLCDCQCNKKHQKEDE